MSEIKITQNSLENAILKDGQFVFGVAGTNGTIISDASGAIAGGYIENGSINATAPGAIALGIGTIANSSGMLAVGQYNTTNSYNGHAPLFKVGNGKGPSALGGKNHDALAIYNNTQVSPAIANQSYVIINGDVSVSRSITANVNGVFDVQLGCPIGTVVMWAGAANNQPYKNIVPTGWLLCDGSEYNWSDYPKLAAVIGTQYGGIVDSKFNVPNLVQRFPLGAKANGTIGINNDDNRNPFPTDLGSTGGWDRATLTADESGLPSHTHIAAKAKGVMANTASGHATVVNDSQNAGDYNSNFVTQENTAKDASLSHNNIPPYLAINFIIKYQ